MLLSTPDPSPRPPQRSSPRLDLVPRPRSFIFNEPEPQRDLEPPGDREAPITATLAG